MSQRDDRVYIGHMLDIANKAIGFVEGLERKDFDNNELLRLSLTHLLQVIGEAARRVSPDFRANYPTIPWKAVVGMRSKVVHDYLDVDEDVVWDTIKNDLPFLIIELEKIMNLDDAAI
ncbi:MAG: DUF86 domain-containing protein [Cyanobacteria bacterium P01_A01_bin.123]